MMQSILMKLTFSLHLKLNTQSIHRLDANLQIFQAHHNPWRLAIWHYVELPLNVGTHIHLLDDVERAVCV